jgi:hypothetical protein
MIKRIIYTTLALLCLQSAHGQSVEIKLNLELGKVYTQNSYSKSSISQDVNGQKVNIEMIMKGKMSYLVKAVTENDYRMDVEYNSISMTMQMPQGSATFSSEKKDKNDIFSTLLGEMVNKPFKITMTKTGEITEVKNISTLIEDVLSHFSQVPENQLAQIKEQFLKSFGEDAFKGSMETITAIYPKKLVEIGDNWEIRTKLETGMSANMISTYTLTESNANGYVIKGNSSIETANKDAYLPINGMPTRYDLTGVMTSEITVDKTSGWVIEAKINQDIRGDVYIKKNPKLPDGLKVPMVMKNTLVYKNQ